MNDKTFYDAINMMAQIRDLEDKVTDSLGHIKSSDIGKVIAAEARSRGMKSVMGVTKNGGHYKWDIVEPSADKIIDDGKAACARLREMGEEVPQTTRKGNAASLRKA